MKAKSIFEKLLFSNSANGDETSSSREFVAEVLESRILYSGAPAYLPQPEVVHESTSPALEADFESIDSFIRAAEEQSSITEEIPTPELVVSATFDDAVPGTPRTYDSPSVTFQRWESTEEDSDSVSSLLEFELVALESDQIEQTGGFGEPADKDVLVDFSSLVQPLSRLTTVTLSDNDANYGVEFLSSAPASIFGLNAIESAMDDLVTYVA